MDQKSRPALNAPDGQAGSPVTGVMESRLSSLNRWTRRGRAVTTVTQVISATSAGHVDARDFRAIRCRRSVSARLTCSTEHP